MTVLLCSRAITVAVSLLGAMVVTTFVARAADGLPLPAALAKYRQWAQLIKTPYGVPMELWARCVAPTPADWKAAEKQYGPHTRRFVRVYGNAAAMETIAAESRKAFGAGSIIVKEKLADSSDADPAGVAFMIKHEPPSFPETNGWEFVYFPAAAGSARGVHEDCAACHRRAASSDYVFGKYPR